jgi:cobalamin biosynthetic protein CobC
MNPRFHGGHLEAVSKRYGIPKGQWIDLSTGVNPSPYPVTNITAEALHRLPYQDEAFKEAMLEYYGAQGLACNGSQQAIEALPKVLAKCPVLLPSCGYQEHKRSWEKAHCELIYYPAGDFLAAKEAIDRHLSLDQACHLVLINPNNPTGLRFEPEQILQWSRMLAKGGTIIVDEAFIDLHPEQSVLSVYDSFRACDNLIVLRSFGKFFGLAGVRLGSVFAPEPYLTALNDLFGPWCVNGPAQWIATKAWRDASWQNHTQVLIKEQARWMRSAWQPLINALGGEWLTDEGLFLTAKVSKLHAHEVYERLAQQGILIRIIDDQEGYCVQNAGSPMALIRTGLIDTDKPSECDRIQRVFDATVMAFR